MNLFNTNQSIYLLRSRHRVGPLCNGTVLLFGCSSAACNAVPQVAGAYHVDHLGHTDVFISGITAHTEKKHDKQKTDSKPNGEKKK